MSLIETKAYTPAEIKSVRFRIPLYQRPYAWEAKQVLQLLDDLIKASLKEEHYYIGILSIGKTETDNDLFDLIDGQQRITTLTLIGRVLIDFNVNWKSFLDNRLYLYGRDEDKKYLDSLKEDSNPNPKMIEAIKTVKSFLKDKSDIEKTLFSEYVYKHAAFFLSEVPSDYTVIEKNLQFVRMNNRGKQLEAHDILKMKLASKIDNPETKSRFVNKWNEFSQMGCRTNEESKPEEIASPKSLIDVLTDTNFTKNEPKENEIFYQSIVSFPEFLLIGLARFNSYDFKISHNKDKLLEVFGFGIGEKWTEDTALKFMECLDNQFELFKIYFIKRDKEENYKLSLKEPTQFITKETPLQSILEKLKMFQSYLYVSTEPHNWLISTFDYLKKKGLSSATLFPIDANDFLNELKIIDNNTQKAISNLSLNYGDNRLRYWFWRLDYYLWENKIKFFNNSDSLYVSNNYSFRENRSIEHVDPQTLQDNSTAKFSDNVKNWFGNLAMISSSQNSSLKNSTFNIKKAYVDSFRKKDKNGTIESLKLVSIFDYETWNEENAKMHGNEMIDVLINSFPTDEYQKIKDLLAEQKLQ